jgi:hypothetical protein
MPRISKRQTHSRSSIFDRWSNENVLSESEASSEDDSKMDADFKADSDDEGYFREKFDVDDIGDLLELCQQQGNLKKISLLLYMTLRYFNISWREIDDFLQQIGGTRCATAHKWAKIYLTGDLVEFNADNRGGKLSESFYDIFPDIENEAKLFATNACQKKTSDFKAIDLRNFIDSKFYELTGLKKDVNDPYVRSERSCRLDLKRWGAKFEKNSQRPYFEGHEREDVVSHRKTFINYFLSRKDHYYTLTDDEIPTWISPSQRPCILMCHDESTFRSGEVSAKRWTMNDSSGFFSKGRGRSYMVSDFLVQHPSGPFFSLNEAEWKDAIKKYPNLDQLNDIEYVKRSVTASINIGTDYYFDNNTILEQFERLFQMLEFKKEFKNNDIEIIVDNARTHTAKSYSLNDFGKSIDTRCPVETITWYDENGSKNITDCYFKYGPNKGKSKGLLEIANELQISVPRGCKLQELQDLLSQHKAFQNVI